MAGDVFGPFVDGVLEGVDRGVDGCPWYVIDTIYDADAEEDGVLQLLAVFVLCYGFVTHLILLVDKCDEDGVGFVE